MKYSRHELVIGKEAQKKLLNSWVGVVGVGGLGCIVASLLTRSGVNLVLVDRDVVSVTDLHRQILFNERDIGLSKVEKAKEYLNEANPDVKIKGYNLDLSSKNIDVLKNCDLIIDCSDNLDTKLLLNEFAVKNKIPLVYGTAIKGEGYVFNVLPKGPCLNCFLEGSKSLVTCSDIGVLNYQAVIIGSLQVSQAFKILLKKDYEKSLIRFDVDRLELLKIKINKRKDCNVCGKNGF
ncbi:MAG: HesA/MoeB/ThiF family protein [Nanoarchaeota archaeon]|nr:HesA/MoeB/ThiF family protein [Nanoarchaeota archaeon]